MTMVGETCDRCGSRIDAAPIETYIVVEDGEATIPPGWNGKLCPNCTFALLGFLRPDDRSPVPARVRLN